MTRHPLLPLGTIACLVLLAPRPSRAGCEPTWGVRLSAPQVASASVGLLIGPSDPPPSAAQSDKSYLPHGLLLQIEPGIGGGKASLGYAKGLFPFAGAGVKASVLRTWGHPVFVEPRRTYAGVEVDASFFVKLSLGVLTRVGGQRPAPSVLVTGGIGIGF